ncbi:MAG: DedA family protein [Bacteroidales bacterium]|jgi:membrane protein YqaA with SNARE-associated domain|nr:DedA family protein [Bacteroidales bacterium]
MEILLQWGYLGLFIGSFLAATILPLSSEIFVTGLLYAGANPFFVFLIATLGNWTGSLTTYSLGWLGKWKWIEKYFKVTPEKLERQQTKISKFGSLLALFVWFPAIGDIIALALGFYKINPYKCVVFMLIGKASRFAVYILLYLYASEKFGFGLMEI